MCKCRVWCDVCICPCARACCADRMVCVDGVHVFLATTPSCASQRTPGHFATYHPFLIGPGHKEVREELLNFYAKALLG